jgi:hypothetical protein
MKGRRKKRKFSAALQHAQHNYISKANQLTVNQTAVLRIRWIRKKLSSESIIGSLLRINDSIHKKLTVL